MVPWHWYKVFFYTWNNHGHFHLQITVLGWITLAVIIGAIAIGITMHR